MLLTIRGNANQNHGETSHLSEWLSWIRPQITNVAKDVETRDPSNTANVNVSCAATVENGMAVSQKTKSRATIWLQILFLDHFSSVQSLSHVQLFATPRRDAHEASLSITNSQSLLKLMSIESVMSSSHLILCRSLPLLPSIFPSIRVFSNESVLHIRWPNYWSLSFSMGHIVVLFLVFLRKLHTVLHNGFTNLHSH